MGRGARAELAAKILPTVDYQSSVTYKGSPESAIKAVYQAIVASEGYREMIESDSNFEAPVFSAIISSGAMNMNPAVVCVTIEPIDALNAEICIFGSAKEGFIKQRTAEKAVLRIAERLR